MAYGSDTITLSEADGVADTVIYRFRSDDTGGWRAADGSDVIHNFELGVDKIIFVDIDTTMDSQVGSVAEFLVKADKTDNEGDHGLAFIYRGDPDMAPLFSPTGVRVTFYKSGGSTGPTESDGTPQGSQLSINYKSVVTEADATDVFWEGAYFDEGTFMGTPSLDVDNRLINWDYAQNIFRGDNPNFDGLEAIGSLTDLGIDIL